MAKHKKPVIGACAYCGVVEKLTIDHVIPECLFEKKHAPPDTPIVYACKQCNNTKKNLDDSFLRDMLVTDIDAFEHPIARGIFEGPVSRAITAQGYVQSPLAELVRRSEPERVPVMSKGGIYLGDAFGFKLPDERVHRIFSTIAEGLYLAYTDVPMPANMQYNIHRVRDIEVIQVTVQGLIERGGGYRQAGDGQVFQCAFGVVPDRPELSVWIMAFYQRVIFVVDTIPPSLRRNSRNLASA